MQQAHHLEPPSPSLPRRSKYRAFPSQTLCARSQCDIEYPIGLFSSAILAVAPPSFS